MIDSECLHPNCNDTLISNGYPKDPLTPCAIELKSVKHIQAPIAWIKKKGFSGHDSRIGSPHMMVMAKIKWFCPVLEALSHHLRPSMFTSRNVKFRIKHYKFSRKSFSEISRKANIQKISYKQPHREEVLEAVFGTITDNHFEEVIENHNTTTTTLTTIEKKGFSYSV
ncbi:hypothetical protein BDC45DRAFT_535178 [Circinella umbellata]|nr:hypothetical protein BDC45DRAFT_535178 [Circinella umbellata]